jgi:hypothetical protein
MSDLVAFLTARLDEDEASARFEELWQAYCAGKYEEIPVPLLRSLDAAEALVKSKFGIGTQYYVRANEVPGPSVKLGDVVALVVLSQGSARVLREVDAKRKILALHGARIGGTWCVTCDPGSDVSGDAGAWYPCLTLRALAAIWSGHPDYDPDWA